MISLLVLVILGCVSKEAWSCSCGPSHPQAVYCNANVVFRAKFIAQSHNEEKQSTMYEIKTTKIFKGPKDLQDIQFLFTPNIESLCRYEHTSTNKSEEFVVAGRISNGTVHINSCSFIAPWTSLTYCQKMGFTQVYEKNCDCKILTCYSPPCSVTNEMQCLWTDPLMPRKSLYSSHQAANWACVNDGRGFCVWDSLKSRKYTTRSKSITQ